MSRYTPKYHLPDPGFTVIHWAHDLGHGRAAMSIEPAIETHRRADGSFAYNDVSTYLTITDGPAYVLREVLDLEALAISHWAKDSFNRFHRRSAARHVQSLCRGQGSEAAVEWVYHHANVTPNLDHLRAAFGPSLYRLNRKNEDFYRNQLRNFF